jgi:hypothetical protein
MVTLRISPPSAGPVDSARRQRHARLGKIQKRAAHELLLGDGDRVVFARLIQAFDHKLARGAAVRTPGTTHTA